MVSHNNYERVEKRFGSYIQSKNTSGTVAMGKEQQKNRHLRNSFQPSQELRLKCLNQRSSHKFTGGISESIDYPGAGGPKARISVPKPLVLHQLSKNIDVIMKPVGFQQNSQELSVFEAGPNP